MQTLVLNALKKTKTIAKKGGISDGEGKNPRNLLMCWNYDENASLKP